MHPSELVAVSAWRLGIPGLVGVYYRLSVSAEVSASTLHHPFNLAGFRSPAAVRWILGITLRSLLVRRMGWESCPANGSALSHAQSPALLFFSMLTQRGMFAEIRTQLGQKYNIYSHSVGTSCFK